MASVKNHMPMLLLFLRRSMARFEKENPLACVITGMEHNGTTLVSQLLNGHPRVA
jgi:chemotaxis response regulator CheB